MHRRALVGKDPVIAVPAGERERPGQRTEGAGAITTSLAASASARSAPISMMLPAWPWLAGTPSTS